MVDCSLTPIFVVPLDLPTGAERAHRGGHPAVLRRISSTHIILRWLKSNSADCGSKTTVRAALHPIIACKCGGRGSSDFSQTTQSRAYPSPTAATSILKITLYHVSMLASLNRPLCRIETTHIDLMPPPQVMIYHFGRGRPTHAVKDARYTT